MSNIIQSIGKCVWNYLIENHVSNTCLICTSVSSIKKKSEVCLEWVEWKIMSQKLVRFEIQWVE